MTRGTLRIYLGAAPGVGKTFAMLNEGWRRAQRGTDVVVGYVEDHGRANTRAQLRDLPIVARRKITYRDQVFEEMDVEAVLARRPAVALVDELAHSNVAGQRQPEAVAGRRGAAGLGHRHHLDGQHPAPRVAQRRRAAHHRRHPARDGPRLGGARRRPGRAGGHGPRSAAPAHGPRQHLRRRQGRRRTRPLLPGGQPVGPPGAGPPVGRRQGGGGTARVPGPPRDRGAVGDQGARRGGPDRLPSRPASGAAGGPHRRAHPRRAHRRPHPIRRRARPAGQCPARGSPHPAPRAGRPLRGDHRQRRP